MDTALTDRQIALNIVYGYRDNCADYLRLAYLREVSIESLMGAHAEWGLAQGILIALLDAFGIEHTESHAYDFEALDELKRNGWQDEETYEDDGQPSEYEEYQSQFESIGWSTWDDQ
jgi:hypothetical protein